MVFFVAALGLLLHVLLWGAGVAILHTPRPWRKMWPVFCAPMGLALQSAVVWVGAYSGVAGANVYARWSEIIPLVFLVIAVGRRGPTGVTKVLSKFRGLGALVVAELCVVVAPMALAAHSLTTLSLGSCDAADYAAGARVLQEFAHGDRSGFMGLTEVVRIASVDNFFDFWLRLNHFTPSALVAFNGAVFGLRPDEIIGAMTAVLLVSTLPAVFWMARAVMRYSPGASLWIAGIYGLNPITWYAVAHVAMGQLLAAHAMVFLTWAGVALWRGRLTWRRGYAMGGVLAMAYWVILGSYNFIIIVALTPVLAFVGVTVLLSGQWRKLGQWLVAMLAPLVVCAVFFPARVLGLVERFQLFGQYDFGWRIPLMLPEGWLGAVSGPELAPLAKWASGLLLALLFVLLVVAAWRDLPGRRRTLLGVAALMLPPIVGYIILEWRGAALGTNASYDAYKLLAVFFPVLLCGLCYWTTLLRSRGAAPRWAAAGAMALVTAGNIFAAYQFSTRMRNPPLIVGPDIVELQKIEAMPEVTSINLNVADFWSRLWANAFLLRKPQYFKTHTYEGRMNTAMRGDWELDDGLVISSGPSKSDSIRIGRNFSLWNLYSPYFLRVAPGAGWYPEEHIARANRRWQWSKGDATIVVYNPQGTPRTATLHFAVRSVEARDLQVWLAGVRLATTQVSDALSERIVPGIVLPPGESTLEFRSSTPPTRGSARDGRTLGFALYGAELEVGFLTESAR